MTDFLPTDHTSICRDFQCLDNRLGSALLLWQVVHLHLEETTCSKWTRRAVHQRAPATNPDDRWMLCRKISLERRLQSTGLSEDQKKQERQALEQQERDYVRLQRQRMSSDDFEALKLIGRGAFGEVLPTSLPLRCMLLPAQ